MSASQAPDRLPFVVNGVAAEVPREPVRSLLDVLRDELDVTGPKPGCGEGVCGACTVLVDGQPVRSCRTWLTDVTGRAVTTIEGLAADGRLHPVQQAFLDEGAFQCGYCTPGMILSTVALLRSTPKPDDDEIRAGLADNVCRCGTYARILAAVRRAAQRSASAEEAEPTPHDELAAPPRRLFDPDRRPSAPWDMTPTGERQWFETLPEGLVVVVEPDLSGGWSTASGAWLHVGGDGVVTAFTGKVDGGQDNRTGLSIAIADALELPLPDVRLVMGDTDLCPHDQGTFGSRSTPDAGRELTAAALAARSLLDRLADASGRSRDRIGDLVRGVRRVEVAQGRPEDRGARPSIGMATRSTAHQTLHPAGRSIMTGEKRYPSDIVRPQMLHGEVLRPPAAGAELRSIDLAEVAAPGVVGVREGSFVGVVAKTPGQARSALRRAKAEWDLPDEPGEADLESHLRAHPVASEGWEGGMQEESGDVESALSSAQIRVAATYRTAFIAHVPLETRVAVAEWTAEGRVTIWTGTQVPFGVREEVAASLGVPEAAVRVVVPDFGGGFGGKHAGEVAVEAARLARAAHAPVKVRWSREEEFRHGYFRPAAVIDIRAGAGRDGRITAWEMRNLNSGSFGLVGPYAIPNQRLDYQPASSPLRQGSYRGLAATANHFARESAMDEVAVALEMDPLELRLSHLPDERLAAAFRSVAERIDWMRPHEPEVGLGIAGGIEKDARVATAVELRVGSDRRPVLSRIVTAFDCGRIVNADSLTNQIQGAMSMGLGGALFEAVRFEAGGRLTNASMTDYRVPRITDMPPLEVVLLDHPDIPSAGAGETPIVALAPAIANAIFAAAGVRLRDLPLIPTGRLA
jgi:nicotinate dehydrogenase subunit B